MDPEIMDPEIMDPEIMDPEIMDPKIMDEVRFGAVSTNYFNLPLWIAVHEGLFAAEGIRADVHLIEAIDEVDRRLAARELDVALSVTENVILDRESGGDLTVLAGNVNRLPFSFIARPDIGSLAELKGRTIGVSSIRSGSSSLVMRILAAEGLEYPGDYTLLDCGPIWARWRMLQSGAIDAGLQGVPLNHMAVDAGFVDLGNPALAFPDFQFVSLNASRRWLDSAGDLPVRLLRAWIRAHDWFYANRAGCTDIAVKEMQITRDHAGRAWDEYVRDEIFPRDATASLAAIDTLIDVSALIRAIPGRGATRAADYVDHSFLEAARASV